MTDLTIYLAGEIHSDWRHTLRDTLRGHLDRLDSHADIEFVGPQSDHARSDDIGETILGEQPGPRYRDLLGAQVNTLRTRVLMNRADLAIAYFGDKYRQWNTAADAGAAVAMDIPLILVRHPDHTHALKELDALATLTVETLEQAARAVAYILE